MTYNNNLAFKQYNNMNPATSDSPLLQQLQQRLTTLIGAKGNNNVPALIAALYHAQQNAGGVLSVAAAEQHLSTTLSDLHSAYPQLIGHADDNTPLVQFSGFIAFRRIYQQLRCVADELQRRQSFHPPSADALQRIAFLLNHRGGRDGKNHHLGQGFGIDITG